MALWNDPLEELIAGLERVSQQRRGGRLSPYDVIGAATDVLLYGTAEGWRQFEMSPEGERIAAYFARLARRRATSPTE